MDLPFEVKPTLNLLADQLHLFTSSSLPVLQGGLYNSFKYFPELEGKMGTPLRLGLKYCPDPPALPFDGEAESISLNKNL